MEAKRIENDLSIISPYELGSGHPFDKVWIDLGSASANQI